jgi:hypothetical protein
MKSAKFSLPASILLLAAFVGQGCFYGGGGYHYPTYYAAPQPAYDPPRAYYAPPPPVLYGAYDERHVWRDRNWWVSNRRQWVQEHHPEWLHNRG